MMKGPFLVGIVCALAAQVIFGFSLIFTRAITLTVTPMTLLSWRFIVALIIFKACILMRIIKIDIKGKPLKPLIALAFLNPFLHFVGETFGISNTSASEAAVFISIIPVATLILSSLLLKETPTKLKILGISFSVAGIIVIMSVRGLSAIFNPFGYIMLFMACVSYALYAIVVQKEESFTSAEKSYVMTAFGAFAFTMIAVVENGINSTLITFAMLPVTNFDFLVAILYLGIGSSVVAFLLYNTSIAKIGATRAVSFAGISTIVAIIAGVTILQESFTFLQGVGAALVISGVYMVNVIPKNNQ